jgi:predicted amidohydrolase
MGALTVAVGQFPSRANDLEGNLARMRPLVAAAAAAGCDLALFAETCLHSFGMTPETVALAESLDGPMADRVEAWAREFEIVICPGFIEKNGDARHNSHAAFFPDGRRIVQRKNYLTETEVATNLVAGPVERNVFEVNGVRCAFIICADSGIEAVWEDTARQGVQLRLCPTAGGGLRGEMMTEAELSTPEGLKRYEEGRRCVFTPQAVLPSERPGVSPAFASANALGYNGVTERGWNRGHCLIVDRFGVLRAQIVGTPVLEHQQAALAWARLEF